MKRLAAIALGALISAPLFLSSAQAAVVVHSVADLFKDPKIQIAQADFEAMVAATVIYEQCSQPYGLTAEQQGYEKAMMEKSTNAYVEAFHDAYFSRVSAEPDKPMVDSYLKIIGTQKANSTLKMSEFIKQKTCADNRVVAIAKYVEDKHHADLVAQAAQQAKKPAAAAVPKGLISPEEMPMAPITTTPPAAAPAPTTPTPGSN